LSGFIFGTAGKTAAQLMQRRLISTGSPMEKLIGFSRAVRVGAHVSIGGTAAIGPDGETVGIGDVAVQTHRCMEIITAALKEAGASLTHVVRTRVLLTNIGNWQAVADVKAEYFHNIRPVETIMEVSRFINPEWLVEIEVDAIIAD
jgi:enamine deaminase RidA (YjgF/YER057c/UK114 family)